MCKRCSRVFFFNDTATTEIYTLSLHDALPICFRRRRREVRPPPRHPRQQRRHRRERAARENHGRDVAAPLDRKSTRLNSSHANISYAVFCLKKKKSDILRSDYTISRAHLTVHT